LGDASPGPLALRRARGCTAHGMIRYTGYLHEKGRSRIGDSGLRRTWERIGNRRHAGFRLRVLEPVSFLEVDCVGTSVDRSRLAPSTDDAGVRRPALAFARVERSSLRSARRLSKSLQPIAFTGWNLKLTKNKVIDTSRGRGVGLHGWLDAPRHSRSRGRSHSDVSAQRVKVRPCRCPSTGRGGRRTRHVSHVTRDSRCG
jgi:hypothetical protein